MKTCENFKSLPCRENCNIPNKNCANALRVKEENCTEEIFEHLKKLNCNNTEGKITADYDKITFITLDEKKKIIITNGYSIVI